MVGLDAASGGVILARRDVVGCGRDLFRVRAFFKTAMAQRTRGSGSVYIRSLPRRLGVRENLDRYRNHLSIRFALLDQLRRDRTMGATRSRQLASTRSRDLCWPDRADFLIRPAANSGWCGNGERIRFRDAGSREATIVVRRAARSGGCGAADAGFVSSRHQFPRVNSDNIARWYRWLEYAGFGRALERRREAFLHEVVDARRILVLGEGDGRFLVKLVQQNRDAAITYVDLSEEMLALARNRAGNDRVRYHHANALTVPLPAAEYDLIVTHFFLDCLTEADAALLIDKLSRAAKPGSYWIVSEFREPAMWARVIVDALYLFFRITTGLRTRRLIDHHVLLKRKGFVLIREQTARAGLLASELWTMVTEKATVGDMKETLKR